MNAFRIMLMAAVASLAACDPAPDDAERTAEELDLEAEEEELDVEIVEGVEVTMPPAPARNDAPDVDDADTSLPLAADIDPQEMKWECNGDPEGGTYVCCRPYGPYDAPWCCWWNGSAYECA